MSELTNASGAEVRLAAREGRLTGPTAGLARGYAQANLVVVPRDLADDFLLFCQRNPRPCPLLEVSEPGSWEPRRTAPGADLRTDVPAYRVFEHGRLTAEPRDICSIWRDDLVSFLLGCSFTFEDTLQKAGLPVRHLECGCNVPMFRTNRSCEPAGIFRGPLVVSMRPMTPAQATRASEICRSFGLAHGEPIQVGNPTALGIADVQQPDFGDPVPVRAGEVPVFWACGVTPQAVAVEARPPLLITHKPGHMFVTDVRG